MCKILVVSDVHGRLRDLRWLLNNETADAMFYLGDGLYDLNAALEGRCVEKIHIFHVPPEERAALQAALEATGPLAVTGSFGTNMELTARGVNKAAAVQALCRRLEVTAEQVMAFGDADNDLELLRWARWSFAMENGAASAKAAARYVTGANRAGGVGMALERYLAAP